MRSSLIRRHDEMVLYGIIVILVCMKGWRGKKSKLVKWISDLAQYSTCVKFFIIFGVLLLIWALCLFYGSFHIDRDSARYLLSALVQSQAAIVAIVVTLTLVAIQLVVSSYSLRAIDIFKKSPLWWFLTCYGVSIFYGLFVLGLIQQSAPPSEPIISGFIPLEFSIYLAYWVGLFTFALLIFYMREIFNFLEPSNIIERLSNRITTKNVVKFIESIEKQKDGQTQLIKDDPVQPIVDIIHGSVMKYDIATTRVGLEKITDRVIEIIDSDSQEEISRYFCNHFNLVGKLTVRNTDEESTGEVIINLCRFGKSATENGLKDAALKVVESLLDIGEIVAEKGFDDATSKVVESLKDVGTLAAKNAKSELVTPLGDFVEISAEKEFENVTTRVAVSLGTVGRITAKKELENAILQVVESLSSVGLSAAKKRLDDTMSNVALSLGDVGISAAERGSKFEHIVIQVAIRLQHVWSMNIKNENVLLRAVSSLGDVGVSAAENRLNDAASEVVRSLGSVGRSAAEEGKGFEHVVQCAVVSLVSIGTTAIEKEELKHTTVEAVQSLAKLTISSEKIVKTTIRELKQEEPDRGFSKNHLELYERPIRQDRDSFQKFIKLYETRKSN